MTYRLIVLRTAGALYTDPASLDLSRQTAEATGRAATRALAAAMFDAYSRATLGRRVLVEFTVLQTMTGRL